MDMIEKEGLSVPEAVFSACMSLGISEKEAQVQILSAPGARRVKVRVARPGVTMPALEGALNAPSAPVAPREAVPAAPAASQPERPFSKPADYTPKSSQRRSPSPEEAEAQRLRLEELLRLMGLSGNIEVKEHAGNTVFNIMSDKEGLLIGKRGMTLEALQEVGHAFLVSASGDPELFALVDVADYRIRQERKIMDKARELADLVLKDGLQQSFGPLSPAERRLVHLELKPMEGVETFSVGSGSMKKVVIQKKAS
jgi:spoIIIJ-associated protein